MSDVTFNCAFYVHNCSHIPCCWGEWGCPLSPPGLLRKEAVWWNHTTAHPQWVSPFSSPQEEPKQEPEAEQLNNGQDAQENGTDSVFDEELDFLNLPDKIEYKEPAWKAALRALEVNDSEPPVKPVRGQATESAPENKENLGCVEVVENNKSTPASEGGQSSDEIENVVLRQPSASRLRRMDRKLGRKPGPPTASKPHTRSLSLPESSNVRLMRQQALDNNHNSATYEDIDDDDEDDYDPVRSVSVVFS